MYKTSIYRIDQKKLVELNQTSLGNVEADLQQWIWDDPTLLGSEVILIGREVEVRSKKRLDLLGIDEDLNICIIELKRDMTAREVVSQVLDYASSIAEMTWADLDAICQKHFLCSASDRVRERFGVSPNGDEALEPKMIIVASQLDEATERIAEFLTARGVAINALLFSTFQDGPQQFIAQSWLLDPDRVEEQARSSKKPDKHPKSGFFFVNVGVKVEERKRSWKDNRTFGFLSVGGGLKYERKLATIPIGGQVFAWLNGAGYVGYGEVVSAATPISNFKQADGIPLDPALLEEPNILTDCDSSDYESAIGIAWTKTLDPKDAVTGWHSVLAVCSLNQPETLAILKSKFEIN